MRQHAGEPRRRWFRSENEELIVWYAVDDSLLGFQLCYGERALRTAILVPDGVFDPTVVLDRFSSAAASLPEDIRRFVTEKIREYS